MNAFSKWSAERRLRDEQAVIKAIRMLRPSQASAYPISRLAHIGPGKVHAVLHGLERSGQVVSEWNDGPFPRRRLYRLVSSAVER